MRQPPIISEGLMKRAQSTADEIDKATKWWNDYPTSRYVDLARPESTFQNYMSNVWSKSKELARSASYSNLTYIKEAEHDFPIRRSTSQSLFAPSLALPQHYRQAERFISSAPVYQPRIHNWYNNAYCKARWLRIEPLKSHVIESQKYLDRYVSARLKADDFAQQYVHTAYDWRYPQDHAFNRHFMYGEGVYIPHAPRIPHSYSDAQTLRKLYVTTGRFRFA